MIGDRVPPRRLATAGTDAASVYEGLLERYRKTSEPVEVDFRAMLHWVRLGDQLTHQLHPYPAKLLPHIAHLFVHAGCVEHPSKVLDPFCGSGTVALEASVAGHIPLVADANPLALLLTRVKTTPYRTDELTSVLGDVLKRARRYRVAPKIEVVNCHIWYSRRIKRELEMLARSIKQIEDDEVRDFFRVCFSVAAKRLSQADPAISVPVRLKESEKHSVLANKSVKARLRWLQTASASLEFEKSALANIERVEATNQLAPKRIQAKKVGVDAKKLRVGSRALPSGSVPLVITSPPYGSAQKYIRASSLSLNWLELTDPRSLVLLETKSMGREHVFRSKKILIEDKLPAEFAELVAKVAATNNIRARITELYLHELDQALMEIARVLAPGGIAVIVIGNNQVCGETLRTDRFIENKMAALGLKTKLRLVDTIKSRGLMTKRNKTASVISRESVLVFER